MVLTKLGLVRAGGARNKFLASTAVLAIAVGSGGLAWAEQQDFTIQPQAMGAALVEFAQQADIEVLYDDEDVANLKTEGVTGASSRDEALSHLLKGSGLLFNFEADDLLVVRPASEAAARDGRIKLNAVLPDNGGQLAQVSEAGQRQARAGDTGRLQVASADLGEDDGEADMEEMIVTGSNIRGARSASPVFVFDRDDIDITGASTVPQFIQTLPQNFGGGASESTAGVVASGNGNINRGTGINLRGLGNDSTLVLLNGRRLAPAGDGTFVDVSMIPLSAIERVEVLTDGASAIYGSDAVGGVVNFRLRQDYDGAETRLRYGTATSGDLDEIQVGQTIGRVWNGGNALVSYEFQKRDELDANDRGFAEETDDPFDLLPRQKRHSVFATIGQNLTETIRVFGDAFYSTRDSRSLSFQEGSAVKFTPDNEQVAASLGSTVTFFQSWQGELTGAFSRSDVSGGTTVIDTGSFTELSGRTSKTWSVDGKVDGPLFSLPGGDIRAALGGQYRRESFQLDTSSDIFDVDDDRDTFAAFGEVFVPLVGRNNQMPGIKRLELTIAGRFEDYSDFGSSTDPKFGALWSPTEGLNFRGTWGTSFRAPLFTELNSIDLGFLFFLPDPSSGATLAAIAFGSTDALEPESATTWTVGVDFQPSAVPGLSFQATYFSIDFEDRIAATDAFFDAFTNPRWASIIDLIPDPELLAFLGSQPLSENFAPGFEFTDAQALVDNRLRNLARVQTQGLDFAGSYMFDSEIGSLGFSVSGTYLFEQTEQLLEVDEPFDIVDTAFNPADLKLRGSISWAYERYAANVVISYVDNYRNERVDPVEKVDSWTTVDLNLRYNTGDHLAEAWLNDTAFSIVALNLFDQNPPFVTNNFGGRSVNFDPTNASPVGRTIALQVTKSW